MSCICHLPVRLEANGITVLSCLPLISIAGPHQPIQFRSTALHFDAEWRAFGTASWTPSLDKAISPRSVNPIARSKVEGIVLSNKAGADFKADAM
jgi:hypothetical protein